MSSGRVPPQYYLPLRADVKVRLTRFLATVLVHQLCDDFRMLQFQVTKKGVGRARFALLVSRPTDYLATGPGTTLVSNHHLADTLRVYTIALVVVVILDVPWTKLCARGVDLDFPAVLWSVRDVVWRLPVENDLTFDV